MKNRALALLSGESTSLPLAEAKALFLTYDPATSFETPEPRVLLADTRTDPDEVAARGAFVRRVGLLISDKEDAKTLVRGKRVRVRQFSLRSGSGSRVEAGEFLSGLDVTVDLERPDFEFTVVEGERRYLAITSPHLMMQNWSQRRPRGRAFFHPSAMFPKLSRAMVNLTRCRRGDVFLDPFAGTGSLPIEASLVGARVVALDLSGTMARGALANMRGVNQEWLGVVRCDSLVPPVTLADAVATDVPYGRASSTMGSSSRAIADGALQAVSSIAKAGSRFVLMHPQSDAVSGGSEWEVEEEHSLYVHKLLTRAITVLRRR